MSGRLTSLVKGDAKEGILLTYSLFFRFCQLRALGMLPSQGRLSSVGFLEDAGEGKVEHQVAVVFFWL